MKRISTVLMSICIALLMLLSVSAENTSYAVGEVVEFGSYPQTLVIDDALIEILNGLEATGFDEEYYHATDYNKYSNTTIFTKSEINSHKEVVYNGEKYRGLYINGYKPMNTSKFTGSENSYQDDNGYSMRKWYWFKYEPLKWKIFNEKGLAICESIVDAQPFLDSYQNDTLYDDGGVRCTVYDNGRIRDANAYCSSYIEDWLTTFFMTTAFTVEEQELMEPFIIDSNYIELEKNHPRAQSVTITESKIGLLTYKQAVKTIWGDDYYGEVDVVKDEFSNNYEDDIFTDYAKAQGGDTENYTWWLATPQVTSNIVYAIRPANPNLGEDMSNVFAITVFTTDDVREMCNGVRPVISFEGMMSDEQDDPVDLNEQNAPVDEDENDDKQKHDEGECGRNMSWKLTENRELIIEGSDTMFEWDDGSAGMPPWYGYCEDIDSVSIGDGVDDIGNLAFYGLVNLKTVAIPSSVAAIGECAFDDCDSLTDIYYGGSESDWEKIEIDEDNIDFSTINIHYNSEITSDGTNGAGKVIVPIAIVAALAVGGVGALIIYRKRKNRYN